VKSPQPRTAILVLCRSSGEIVGQLPPFTTEMPWWQDAEGMVRWVREHHNVDVTILRLLHATLPSPPGGVVTYLAETDDKELGSLPLAPWDGVLDRQPFRLPYAEPGGPGRDLAWAVSQMEAQGFRRAGPAEQVRTWNLSSIWRIPVEGETLWLKCVPPFCAHEGAILARLQGGPVPSLIAHEPGRILMRELLGDDQYGADRPILFRLVSILVKLQVEWIGCEPELFRLGLPDWRSDPLRESIQSVVRRTAPKLTSDDVRTLDTFVAGLPDRFAALRECGIPHTLVHGDFHPGNARRNGDHITLLDWGDCGVGHPLLDQSAFTERLAPELVAPVADHWHDLWRQALPHCDPERAAELLGPLADTRQAVIYQAFLDRIEPAEHPYHQDDPALWLARAAEHVRTSG
jgi:Phosphotransferase enzyme family